MRVDDEHSSCAIWARGDVSEFSLGVEYVVDLEFLLGAFFVDRIRSGMRSTLHDGARVVGEVEILRGLEAGGTSTSDPP